MNTGLLTTIRSLGFGAMFGGGVCGLAYCLFEGTFSPHVVLRDIIIVGALVGGGLHQIIAKAFDAVFRPVTTFISYYGKLVQLTTLRRLGIISSSETDKLLSSLTREYFIGSSRRLTTRL